MNAQRQRKLLWIAAIVVGVAVAVGLILYALRAQTDFFFNPSQLAAGEAPEDRRIRAGGMVVADSVIREAGSLSVQFKITDFKAIVPVSFTGILPDLFAENSGMVATGRFVQGTFMADEILAKHDENYMPAEVDKMLQSGGRLPDGSPMAVPVSNNPYRQASE
ncbi:MAG: cytochrome c maturation protein CcmE [Pseudomonadota bacterium]|nr:cytochrome c maturation protein CcmE [Pseudomonadota bacterium]